MEYRHTQTGYVALIVTAFFVVVMIIVGASLGATGVTFCVAAFMAFLAIVVIVSPPSLPTVASGWPSAGVGHGGSSTSPTSPRSISGGWIYNVWGLDAVELDLASGRKFRIGTDETIDLAAALTLHTALRPDPGV